MGELKFDFWHIDMVKDSLHELLSMNFNGLENHNKIDKHLLD
jgi:hypothetical protein